MANATDVWITSLQGTDPQNLMPYMTRQHIYDCRFWKEECFGLTVTTVLTKAAHVLQCVGGTFGPNQQPTKFICLALKLLQLQPDYDVLVNGFLHQEEFKYVRALGCFFLRFMTVAQRPHQVYQELEPLYRDYRMLRMRLSTSWTTIHMDEFVHTLLTQDTCCGLGIPRLPLRHLLVQQGYLEDDIRRSALQDVVVGVAALENQGKDDKIVKDDDDDDQDEDQEDQGVAVIDEQRLMAYLQHKAEQQQCVAAQVLLEARLQKKQQQQQDEEIRQSDLAFYNSCGGDNDDLNDGGDNDDDYYDDGMYSYYQPSRNDKRHDGNHYIQRRSSHHRSAIPAEVNLATAPPSSSSSSSSSFKDPPSKRKYENLFKKSKTTSKHETIATTANATTMSATTDNNNSEAYWNAERVKLGLKPLK